MKLNWNIMIKIVRLAKTKTLMKTTAKMITYASVYFVCTLICMTVFKYAETIKLVTVYI